MTTEFAANQTETPLGLRQQLRALETRSQRAAKALESACDSLRQSESELDEFLTRYYEKLGGYFEELSGIEHEIAILSGKIAGNSDISPDNARYTFESATKRRFSGDINRQIKQIYRQLAKNYHPDNNEPQPVGGAVMRSANAAYAARNLGALWRIQWEMEQSGLQGEPEVRIARLNAQCNAMEQSLADIQAKRRMMMESPSYALMQRALQLRLCGQDFFALVEAHMKRQIAQQRKALVSARIKSRYLGMPPASPVAA